MSATQTTARGNRKVKITIDKEFRDLIPPLSPQEQTLLEESIIRDGCRDALLVWTEKGILLDGHNRHGICQDHGIEFDVKGLSFDSRNDAFLWMIRNQLGRRNISLFDRSKLALRLEPIIAEKAKENQRGGQGGVLLCQNSDKASVVVDTKKEIAKAAGVSHDTIAKVKLIEAEASDELKARIISGETSIFGAWKELRRDKRRNAAQSVAPVSSDALVSDSLEDIAAGGQKFGCIYADPPWSYGNQGTRASTGDHYGTMTVDDIAALPVGVLAADDCHLHLWTTNAFLFDSKRVMESWGFEYKSCFVWVKPQMGMGNYWRVSHEFLLVGIKGKPQWGPRNMMSWGEFPRSRHSAKPEQVRDLVMRASKGPYLELFGRKTSPGWTVFGNQVERTMFDEI